MVNYIGTARLRELVARQGVARFMEALAGEIESDYRRWAEFDKSARHACHSPAGVIELMPTSDGRLYSFKYVNGHPRNTAAGLLTVTAFGVLADVATGYPMLLSEMTFLTALRTAAISALAAGYMARPGCRAMALIGNGAQSEFQAIAFHHMLGIRDLRLFDTDTEATAKLKLNLESLRLPGLTMRSCTSIAEAVRGADIVTSATADKRNALHPDAGDDRAGHAPQCRGRRLPRQDGAARGHPAAVRCAHRGRVRASGPHRGRDSAARRRRARHRARRHRFRQVARQAPARGSVDFRFGGIRAQRFLLAALLAPSRARARWRECHRSHPSTR